MQMQCSAVQMQASPACRVFSSVARGSDSQRIFQWAGDRKRDAPRLLRASCIQGNMKEWKEGDLVWAKVRGFPWWPGQVMDPSKATEKARAREKPGRVLIAFAGDGSFNWLLPKDIQSFGERYEELREHPNLSKALAPSFTLGVEEMKELLDKRRGVSPATDHKPVDFLDAPSVEGNEGELPPTPDADALRSCSAAAALAWLRAAATSLSEDGAWVVVGEKGHEGEGAASSPEAVVASAKAQILGLRKKQAIPSSEAPTGGRAEAAAVATAGKKKGGRGRWASGGKVAEEEEEEGEEKKSVKKGADRGLKHGGGRTPQAAAAAGSSGKKRGRPRAAPVSEDEGGDGEGERDGSEAAEEGAGAAAGRPKRARRPPVVAKVFAPPGAAEMPAGGRGRGGSAIKRAPGQRWPLPGGWESMPTSLAVLRALAAGGGLGMLPQAEKEQQQPPQDEQPPEEQKQNPKEQGQGQQRPRAAEGAAEAAPVADGEAALPALASEQANAPACGEPAAKDPAATPSAAAAAASAAVTPAASTAPDDPQGMPPVAAVALLRAREALCKESSLRRGLGAGPVLMAALAEAKVLYPARRGRKKGGGAGAAPAAEEPEIEAEAEAESESWSEEDGEDEWAPRAKWKAGRGARAHSEELEGSESEVEEEEEEEGGAAVAGPGGKKQRRAGQQAKAEGGGEGRRRGGRTKGGVPCEAPEIGDEARRFDYASKVPATQEEFDAALVAFYVEKKCNLVVPKIDKEQVDLYLVFKEVAARGGFEAVTARREWREVGLAWRESLGGTATTQLREKYKQYLLAFEQSLREGCPTTTFKTPQGGRRPGGKRELSSPSVPSSEGALARKKAKKMAIAGASPAAASVSPSAAGGDKGEGAEEPSSGEIKGGGKGKEEGGGQGGVEKVAPPGKAAAAAPAPAAAVPLIPRKAALSKGAGAGGKGEGAGAAKTAIKLRFPKEYALPSQATIQTKMSRWGPVKSTMVYTGFKLAVVVFEKEEYAEKCFNAIHEGAGSHFHFPSASVQVAWEEERQKPPPEALPPQQAQQPAQHAAWPAQQAQHPGAPMAQVAPAPIYTAQQALPLPMMGYALMPPMGPMPFGIMAQQAQQGGPQDPRRALAPAGPEPPASTAQGAGSTSVFGGLLQQQPMQLYSNAPPATAGLGPQLPQQLEAPAGMSGMDLMNILQAAGVAPGLAPGLVPPPATATATAAAPQLQRPAPLPQQQVQPLLDRDAASWDGDLGMTVSPAASAPALTAAASTAAGAATPPGEVGVAQQLPVDDYSTQLMALLGQFAQKP